MMAPAHGPIRVVGRYALYAEIAAGGMATVHIGRLLGPVGFARTVAIKRLHPQYAKDPEFVSMFLDEARIAARVQHPNVVATIDVVATDGELFLIMDYVRGESLSKLVRASKKKNERIPPKICAAVMCGFLHGLHAAHEAKNERGEPLGMVHRDVSPQNVLVGSDGIARVLDFGIAKAQGRIQVTRDGQIKGKLAYMPPEQLSGRELTRAVDIYASAVVMWEMLTGERLFKADTEAETLTRILRDPVPAPTQVVPSLPRAFDNVLLRALSRDASRRPQTARELALELEKCTGMASPTEVGEWVEDQVGPVLAAREDQIARIESASTGLRVTGSGRPEALDLGSDSTSAPFIPSNKEGTLLGVGPPSGTMPLRDREPADAEALALADDGSKITGSRTMSLPTNDRRWPLYASLAGLVVLCVIVGVILANGASTQAKVEPPVSASVTPPPPPPPDSAAVNAKPPATNDEPSSSAPITQADPEPKPTHGAHVPSHPPPPVVRPTFVAPPPPPPKKDCTPPYTIDSAGHKRYKLECM